MAVANSKADAARGGRQFLTLREAVKATGTHPNTIRRAADACELRAFKLPSGHRRFKMADLLCWLGVEDPAQEIAATASHILIYARVSSHKQSKGIEKGSLENDLSRQIERLKKTALGKYECSTPVIYSDTGSGLSFTRKGLNRLINDILNGKFNHSVLLVEHKDRLARFGTEVLLEICKFRNIDVVFVEKELDESRERELADDLIAIITHFAAITHGARSAKTNSKILAPDTIKRAKALLDSGISTHQVLKQLQDEGFTSPDGSKLSYFVISKYVFHNKLLKEILPTRAKTNLQEYADQFLEPAEPHARISTRAVYEHYSKWAAARGETPAKINRLSQLLGKRGYQRDRWYDTDSKAAKGYAALKIKGENFHNYIKQIRRGSSFRVIHR